MTETEKLLIPVTPTEEIIDAMKNAFRSTRRPSVSGMTIDAQWRAENAQWIAVYRAIVDNHKEGDAT